MKKKIDVAPRTGMSQDPVWPELLNIMIAGHPGSFTSTNQAGVPEAFKNVTQKTKRKK